MSANATPIQFVLLGGTGDLSTQKLLPALFDLYAKGKLGKHPNIIGIARSERTDAEYQDFVRSALVAHQDAYDNETVEDFCKTISYLGGDFAEQTTFSNLTEHLNTTEANLGTKTNRLFYLAVPPRSYGDIFHALHDSGAAVVADDEQTWSRILVEKPFGHDLSTAQELDALLSKLYTEEQIYRIDHYLAKEAMQNILSFRFANRLLSYAWNREAVESITIKMHETKDVGERTNFYEGVGALRDVGQNHLLQILALIAMDEPAEFTAAAIRSEREKVLQALVPVTDGSVSEHVYRAQYEGYTGSDTVADDSTTETYFELVTTLDVPRWAGVPFYISAGKALAEAEVSVVVTFKDVTEGMFKTEHCETTGNQVVLTISPKQTIGMTLNAKEPGLGFQLESRTLAFACEAGDTEIKNSYEKVLYDCITGDQTLFTTTEEVLAAWRYITPILESWTSVPLHTYQKGTTPEAALFTNV